MIIFDKALSKNKNKRILRCFYVHFEKDHECLYSYKSKSNNNFEATFDFANTCLFSSEWKTFGNDTLSGFFQLQSTETFEIYVESKRKQ